VIGVVGCCEAARDDLDSRLPQLPILEECNYSTGEDSSEVTKGNLGASRHIKDWLEKRDRKLTPDNDSSPPTSHSPDSRLSISRQSEESILSATRSFLLSNVVAL
jgi:hypothetical protein